MPEYSSNIVPCPHCHNLYDTSKFSVCPYCQGKGNFQPTTNPSSHPAAPAGKPSAFSPTMDPLQKHQMNPSTGPESWQVPTFPVNNPNEHKKGSMGPTQIAGPDAVSGMPLPVVGWLVALNGPHRGTDFRIHSGYNYIGRDEGDICVPGDMTISSRNDSDIIFVPQSSRFYIAHEQGKNVLLVNGEPVIGNGLELNSYDKITIGSTEFVFIGLCGERFSWREEDHG